MKQAFLALTLLITSTVFSQEKNTIPKDKWSKKYYISDEFMATKGLKPGETNGLLRAWNAETKDKGLMRVVDLRWYFNTAEEATQYLKLNLPYLSESGDPINQKIKIENVSNLYLYNEGAGARSMNKALGVESYSYFFLFTVKNFVGKVFVNTGKQMKINEAAVFAKEAARRLNAATK